VYRVCGRDLGDRINRGDRLRFDGVKVGVDAQRRTVAAMIRRMRGSSSALIQRTKKIQIAILGRPCRRPSRESRNRAH